MQMSGDEDGLQSLAHPMRSGFEGGQLIPARTLAQAELVLDAVRARGLRPIVRPLRFGMNRCCGSMRERVRPHAGAGLARWVAKYGYEVAEPSAWPAGAGRRAPPASGSAGRCLGYYGHSIPRTPIVAERTWTAARRAASAALTAAQFVLRGSGQSGNFALCAVRPATMRRRGSMAIGFLNNLRRSPRGNHDRPRCHRAIPFSMSTCITAAARWAIFYSPRRRC